MKQFYEIYYLFILVILFVIMETFCYALWFLSFCFLWKRNKSTWLISQNEFIQKAVLFLFRYSIWILLLDLIFCSSVILLCITWIEGVFIRIIVFIFMWFSCLTDFGSDRPVIKRSRTYTENRAWHWTHVFR